MPQRHRYRGSLRRILAAETLEPRLTMDAAPYVISISGEATLEGTSSDYETGAFDSQTRPILGALQNPAAATPNVPYEAINGLDEELRVEAGRSGGNAYSQVGFG